MFPVLEDLEGLSKEQVIAEIKRIAKISKEKYGVEYSPESITSLYLKELGLE